MTFYKYVIALHDVTIVYVGLIISRYLCWINIKGKINLQVFFIHKTQLIKQKMLTLTIIGIVQMTFMSAGSNLICLWAVFIDHV